MLDDDTSLLRARAATGSLDLRTPVEVHTRSRGIITGAALGVLVWLVLAGVGVAAWHWLTRH